MTLPPWLVEVTGPDGWTLRLRQEASERWTYEVLGPTGGIEAKGRLIESPENCIESACGFIDEEVGRREAVAIKKAAEKALRAVRR